MNGKIELTDYISDFDAAPNSAPDGRPYPETLLSIVLTGTNQSGEAPKRVIIRFRDAERLSANPSISGSDIILDLPKHDFAMVQDMIEKSILAKKDALKLSANYRVIGSNTWVNLSLR